MNCINLIISSRWCALKWKIPPVSDRNGVIIKYIIELEQVNDTKWNITHNLVDYNFSSPSVVTYNVTNLTPYTNYKWRVAAATVNGTGPFSPNGKSFQTLEDGKNVQVHILCTIHFMISLYPQSLNQYTH